MKRDAVAGAFLANAIPHALIGAFGKRGLTPLGGEDSSASLNLAWAGINLGAGTALLAFGGWRGASQGEVERRMTSVICGEFAMLAFGMVYELTTGQRKRAERSWRTG